MTGEAGDEKPDRSGTRFIADEARDSLDGEFFRGFAGDLPDPVVTADRNGRVVFANRAVETHLGYDPSTLLGRSVAELLPVEHSDLSIAADPAGSDGPGDWTTVATTCRCADGSRSAADVLARQHELADGQYVTLVVRDLHCVGSAAGLSRLTARALESSPVGSAVFDREGRLLRANLAGRAAFERFDLSVGDQVRGEIQFVDETGAPIPPPERPLKTVVENGEPVTGWEGGIRGEADTVTWILVDASPLCDADGAVEYVVMQFDELTGTRAELRALKERVDILGPLERYTSIVREITRSIAEMPTREDVERVVCETLAAADPYLFAVVGEFVDAYSQFVPRVWAGIEEGYLGEIVASAAETNLAEGPGAQAIKTRQIQVTQNISVEDRFDPRRPAADPRGYRSVASVPLVHRDVAYGVLGVYADRPFAFDENEALLLEELGRVVGLAISAATGRELLQADTVTELTLEIVDERAHPLSRATRFGGTWSVEGSVPVEDGAHLQHVTVEDVPAARLEADLPDCRGVEAVRVVSTTGGSVRLELRVNDGGPVATVVDWGGAVRSAVTEDDVCRVVVSAPPTISARSLLSTLEASFPGTVLRSKRQVDAAKHRAGGHWTADGVPFTDRQREVLAVAHGAGYYEWPRDTTVAQLAEGLDVTPPTVLYHLRQAERKLVSALFDADE
jgi:PAS domain S-box-containing protein